MARAEVENCLSNLKHNIRHFLHQNERFQNAILTGSVPTVLDYGYIKLSTTPPPKKTLDMFKMAFELTAA